MSAVLGALLFGVTMALLASSFRPPERRVVLRHEPFKAREVRRRSRRRARFRVREAAPQPREAKGVLQRLRQLSLVRREQR
jgi:hypothetical protein